MRMRPLIPEELDTVDWRGRWIDEEEEYEEEEEEEDRQMEDFDPVSLMHRDSSRSLLMCSYRMLAMGKTMMMRRRRKRRKREAALPLDFQQTKPR